MMTSPTRAAARRSTRAVLAATVLAATALALLPALPAATAGAQDVGYPPEESPYRDVIYRQELTLFGGFYRAGKDPEGVAPQSGPMGGVHYELRIGGPANVYGRLGLVRTERDVVDPASPPEQRDAGQRDVNLLLADVGLVLNLTGQKSWRGFVPHLNGGVGVVSDLVEADGGGFRLGTPFAIAFGAGVKWVSRGDLQLRVDVRDHLYQVRYPESYYVAPAPGVEPVRAAGEAQNVWKHNVALTVGASYLFFR